MSTIRRPYITDIVIGLVAGIVATKVTDLAQGPLQRATPDYEKEREPDTPDESAAMTAARKAVELADIKAAEDDLKIFKTAIHYGLGAGWGSLYGFLRCNTDLSAASAGVVTGTALSLIVDEVLNPLLNITPPAQAYPASSHLRGLAAHLVYGIVVAAVGESLHRLVEHRRDWA